MQSEGATVKVKLNLGAGKKPLPKADGWINVDKFDYLTTEEFEYKKMDLFRYPWDIPDNSVDEVFCSHIIEHIPHEPKFSLQGTPVAKRENATTGDLIEEGWVWNRWLELSSLDGFFAFFAEMWRVCQPDAVINIVCPFGYTRGAFQDPTHTRYIVPATFFYLQSQENENWDYHLPLKFSPAAFTFSAEQGVVESFKTQEEWEFAISHFWDVVTDLVVRMTVVK